jgi:UDP-N-acetyl-2-amino-2-deoxyglucuronate dehydrogenase
MNLHPRIGIIGTGAIAHMHARAWNNIGCPVTVCTNRTEAKGREFAARFGAGYVSNYEEVCRHPDVDIVDVCTFPDIRLQPLTICAETRKHIQVQKPIATNLETARQMIDIARAAGIQLGVVSQHRFDDACLFLSKAVAHGRLGRLLLCDLLVMWYL